ncbi:MAG: SGNH/GDSL hydrolase family protein [Nocardioidaceae bacterium]
MGRSRVIAVAALSLLALLAACSGAPAATNQPEPTATASDPPRYQRYVATGDSYSAGPLIATTESQTGCFRSDHNYPHLLAERLKATLVDVTCSAAETKDYAGRQHTLPGPVVAPQLKAVTPDTDLVTVGIGGNDFGLFIQGISSGAAPAAGTVDKIGARVRRVLEAVHAKAPEATVVLVGYPRLVDPGTRCPRRLSADSTLLHTSIQVQRELNRAMRRAATATDSRFIDMFALSKGHGICSKTPWVNGQQNLPGKAAAFHPFVAEMRAAADAIARSIS